MNSSHHAAKISGGRSVTACGSCDAAHDDGIPVVLLSCDEPVKWDTRISATGARTLSLMLRGHLGPYDAWCLDVDRMEEVQGITDAVGFSVGRLRVTCTREDGIIIAHLLDAVVADLNEK